MLGFLLKAEVDAIFKQQPIEPAVEGADPFNLWRTSFEASQKLSSVPRAEIELVPQSVGDLVAQIKCRRTYREYYEAIADYSFGLAPIDALLSPQWFADLDYVDELGERISEGMAIEEQLSFAVSEGTVTEPIIVGNQVIFTSHRRDLHADQIPQVREIEPGEFEIVVRAASRPNYIQVAVLGDRLLLTNGVHKVCALCKKGFKRVPCLWRRIGRLEETGLNLQGTTLLRPELVNGSRPAAVVDFLDERIAVPLKMRSMYQVMRVAAVSETYSVPAILQAVGNGSP